VFGGQRKCEPLEGVTVEDRWPVTLTHDHAMMAAKAGKVRAAQEP
jgi:hypothetical protein